MTQIETIGMRIRRLLAENNMTQEALATATERSQAAVNQWVSDKKKPEFISLRRMSDRFNKSIDYIYFGDSLPAEFEESIGSKIIAIGIEDEQTINNPAKYSKIKHYGSAMSPTIQNGAYLTINLLNKELIDGNIYAFRVSNEVVVRRYMITQSNILLCCDNLPAFNETIKHKDKRKLDVIGVIERVENRLV